LILFAGDAGFFDRIKVAITSDWVIRSRGGIARRGARLLSVGTVRITGIVIQ
jgi:hypothetical protein